jgi:transposase
LGLSGRSRQGSKWRGTLIEAARAAARTRNSYLSAQYPRVRPRRGANRASLAVAYSLLVAVRHMLTTGETYTDPGADYYTRRDSARTTKRLVAQLERLGYAVTLQQGAAGRPTGTLIRVRKAACGRAGRPESET